MAIIRPGPLVGAISGSVGGVTFRQSTASTVACSRQRPPSNDSQQQLATAVRLNLTYSTWKALDFDEQQAWATAAKSTTITNRLGVPFHLSPFHYFVYCTNRRDDGQLAGATLTPLPNSTLPIEYTSPTLVYPDTASFVITPAAPDTSYVTQLFAHKLYKTRIRSLPSYWHYVVSFHSSAGAYNAWDDLEAVLGPIAIGDYIWFKFRRFNRRSPPSPAFLQVLAVPGVG